MNERSLASAISVPLLLAVAVASLLVQACREGCEDVVCAPSPPLLTVTVLDTLSVDTSLTLISNTGDTSVVDTLLVVRGRATAEATVYLFRMQNGAAVPFDTLTDPDGFTYQRTEALEVSSADTVLIVGERAGRRDTVENVTLRSVDGCCPYNVLGTYTVTLPDSAG